MSSYCNIYRVSPNVVRFGIYNFLDHIDGHITVWIRTDDLRWCWAKTAGYGNLASVREIADAVVRMPDERDAAVIWPVMLRDLKGTCDRYGKFILPEDQAKADEAQKELEDSPADSWQRKSLARGSHNHAATMPWGAQKVATGCPIIEMREVACDDPDTPLNAAAVGLLGDSPEPCAQNHE